MTVSVRAVRAGEAPRGRERPGLFCTVVCPMISRAPPVAGAETPGPWATPRRRPLWLAHGCSCGRPVLAAAPRACLVHRSRGCPPRLSRSGRARPPRVVPRASPVAGPAAGSLGSAT
eukprot:8959680-Pyramimonas_sp.AAC.1